jgi:hypothetical protein
MDGARGDAPAQRQKHNSGEIRLALSLGGVSLSEPQNGEVAEWSIAALC